MTISDALVAFVALVKSKAPLRAVLGEEVHIDYPGEYAPGSPVYKPANSRPFAYLGPVSFEPAGCDGIRMRFAVYVESFAADRCEALDCARLLAFLDGEQVLGQSLAVVSGGESDSPFTPFSAQATFTLLI
jgi:hypothetical protein